MLRAFRFASQLDFKIADDVLDSVARSKEKLRTVSAERIADELSKLMTGVRPGPALEQAEALPHLLMGLPAVVTGAL